MHPSPRIVAVLTLSATLAACDSDNPSSPPPTNQDVTVTWENPFPPASITDIWGASTTDIHAVGSDGQLLHYDGDQWSVVDSPTRRVLFALWGTATDNVVAVGVGTIVRFDGEEWTLDESPTIEMIQDVWGPASDTLYAVTFGGSMIGFDGTAWQETPPPPSDHFMSIGGTSGNDFYVGGDSLYQYNGNDWTRLQIGMGYGVHSISAPSRDDVWVAHGLDWLWHYDGRDWTAVDAAFNGKFTSVWATGTDVFAAGWGGIAAHHDGVSWDSDVLTNGNLFGVWASNGGEAWVASGSGFASAIHHFDGADWSTIGDTNGPYVLRAIWSNESGTRVVAAGGQMIMEKVGDTWQTAVVDPNGQFEAVWGSPSGDVFVCGGNGSNARFDGVQLHSFDLGIQTDFSSVWGTSNTNVYMGARDYDGPNNGLWHYDGNEWTLTSISDRVNAIWGTDASNVWIAGRDAAGNAVVKRYNGYSWKLMYSRPAPNNAEFITGYSDTEVFVAGHEEAQAWLQHYNGHTWSVIAPPINAIYGLGASRELGLVMVSYGSNTTYLYRAGDWQQLDMRYTAHFLGVAGYNSGVYLAGGAHIVRCHY